MAWLLHSPSPPTSHLWQRWAWGAGAPLRMSHPLGKGLLGLEAQELMPPEKTPEVRRLSIPPTSSLELGLLLPWQVGTGCPGKKGLRDFPGAQWLRLHL